MTATANMPPAVTAQLCTNIRTHRQQQPHFKVKVCVSEREQANKYYRSRRSVGRIQSYYEIAIEHNGR